MAPPNPELLRLARDAVVDRSIWGRAGGGGGDDGDFRASREVATTITCGKTRMSLFSLCRRGGQQGCSA
ncbi:unnamed protein product [Lampetra fluviatilis]